MRSSLKVGMLAVASALMLMACGGGSGDSAGDSKQEISQGRWLKGDLHVHTIISGDAQVPQDTVVSKALGVFGLDFLQVSNHLRGNSKDANGNTSGNGYLASYMIGQYEAPRMTAEGALYQSKPLWSAAEWDMPKHEHMNIGVLADGANSPKALEAYKQFEYMFGSKDSLDQYPAEDVKRWTAAGLVRSNQTHADGIKALKWLQDNFPGTSYAQINHPLRHANNYTIADIREMNDTAPEVVYLLEGMVGNQFGANRGEYDVGTYGGADPMIAKVGGWWDALLGEGRQIWNTANSDFHFKIINPYSSGYYPGEFAKTYVYVTGGNSAQDIIKAYRSGKSFAVWGDLIDSLDFNLQADGGRAEMGQALKVKQGQTVTVSITFSEPEFNNQEKTVGNEVYHGTKPPLHHIDLIAGNVGAKAQPNTPAYAKETNDSTRVVKSFPRSEWTKMANGRYAVSYTFTASADQYFRLRGTNLDYNVSGVTQNGEPLLTASLNRDQGESDAAYFDRINKRNYAELWMYSNPIFTKLQ